MELFVYTCRPVSIFLNKRNLRKARPALWFPSPGLRPHQSPDALVSAGLVSDPGPAAASGLVLELVLVRHSLPLISCNWQVQARLERTRQRLISGG